MRFSKKLALSAIALVLFTFGFGYYQAYHPWPSTLVVYPCLLAIGLVAFLLYVTPSKHY